MPRLGDGITQHGRPPFRRTCQSFLMDQASL